MSQAKDPLISTNSSMSKISESIGYQSEVAFSKVVKINLGIAPDSYRRKSSLTNVWNTSTFFIKKLMANILLNQLSQLIKKSSVWTIDH